MFVAGGVALALLGAREAGRSTALDHGAIRRISGVLAGVANANGGLPRRHRREHATRTKRDGLSQT